MDLLFRREQTIGRLRRVNFNLWGKIELDQDEQAIVGRYRFDEAVLIAVLQPLLLRHPAVLAGAAFVLALLLLIPVIGVTVAAVLLSAAAGFGAGYWYVNEKRETILVRDLLHGRHFTCDSVVTSPRRKPSWKPW